MSRLIKKLNKSLTSRITILSFMGISIAILIAGSSIIWSFNRAMQRSMASNISAYMDIFIAATSVDKSGNVFISSDTNILNNIPRYWQITSGGKQIKKSPLLKQWVPVDPSNQKERISFSDADGTEVIARMQTVIFPGNKPVTYLFGIQREIAMAYRKEQRQQFIQVLSLSLGVLVGILVLLTYFQVKTTIRPLVQIRQALMRIKSGQESRLEKDFPNEIQPLADEINALLDYSLEVVERHRSFASNLSHSLKTPLSVLSGEAQKSSGALADLVKEKSSLMLTIIDRNLARANIAGSSNILGARVEVLPVLNKISNSFAKLYEKKVSLSRQPEIAFKGDAGDLFELMGNIIENACKYSKSEIAVKVWLEDQLVITIDDDGKGIQEVDRKKVLERGVRLDEAVPGTGIGLPIAKDIADLYNGEIVLCDSELGGLKIILRLPAA